MKQYEVFELVWKAQAPENSDVKADLRADFLYEDGETVKVKGFYAGAGAYKVRFLPVKTGKVTWKITGMIEEEGTGLCEPNENGTGLVRAVGTHFEYQNGKRFSPFGTTVYALAHQDQELIDETFASLAAAPFNKVRHCIFPKHYDYNHNEPQYYPFEKKADGSWDTEHPCFGYWDHMEEIINRLGAMGIQSDLILFHPYDRWKFSEMSMEENLNYLDYLLRRFSAIPYIWWSLANEYDLCFAKSLDDWHTIEQYVHDNDPFGHLLSNHNCFRFYDFSRENITHCSLQSCAMHRATEFMERYGKPVVFDECCYEGDIQHSWGNITGFEMVNRFWQGAVQGAFVTHGETFYSEDEILWWSRGGKLKGKSAPKIAYLREFIENLPGALEPWDDMEITKVRKLKGTEEAAKVPIISLICSTDAVDFEDMMWKDAVFSGRIGEKVFIKYLGSHASRLFFLKLPENHKYKVEVIDVWEMTRTTLIEEASGETRCMLPGKEGIAVMATLIGGMEKMTTNQYIKQIRTYSAKHYRLLTREPDGNLEYPFLVPGSASYSNCLWDWDSWLTNIAVRQIMADQEDSGEDFFPYEKGCILNFLNCTTEDGWMPITISTDNMLPMAEAGEETNIHKPCLAQHAAFIIESNGGECKWLEPYVSKLEAYLSYYRCHMFHEKTGLYFWVDDMAIGVDNDPSTFYRPDKSSASIYLNCLMYKELLAMTFLCKKLELPFSEYEKQAEELKKAVQENLWDERNGFYYSADLNLKPIDPKQWLHSGMPRHWHCLIQRIDCWAGFMAMWAGIATEAQAERMVKENLLRENLFHGAFGVRTLARTEKMYCIVKSGNPSCWLGPVWGISNYMCYRGLKNYGYDKEAAELAVKTIRLFGKDLKECGELHEYYDPDTGEGVNNQGFQCWNLLVNNMIAAEEGRKEIREF